MRNPNRGKGPGADQKMPAGGIVAVVVDGRVSTVAQDLPEAGNE